MGVVLDSTATREFQTSGWSSKAKLLLQHMLLIVLRKNSEVENQKFGLGNFTIK